eukprot:TRINITY_DN24891_c0_g1_i1.p1 TRINITY_DN24891_c0_g1~~TRINITY_DN24891_c0_g1_i1.p1  ORF type:complete len:243 (-),score=11.87 TRINITY_DN24891_c0_g1_i1:21-662(-)
MIQSLRLVRPALPFLGPVFLPTKIQRVTLISSPFKFSYGKEQWERRTRQQAIFYSGPTKQVDRFTQYLVDYLEPLAAAKITEHTYYPLPDFYSFKTMSPAEREKHLQALYENFVDVDDTFHYDIGPRPVLGPFVERFDKHVASAFTPEAEAASIAARSARLAEPALPPPVPPSEAVEEEDLKAITQLAELDAREYDEFATDEIDDVDIDAEFK